MKLTALRAALRAIVLVLAVAGVVSFGLNWERGKLFGIRWDFSRPDYSLSGATGGLFFDDAIVTYVASPTMSGLYQGTVQWQFRNISEKPVTMSFPSQHYLMQAADGSYATVELPANLAQAAPVTLTPRGVHTCVLPTAALVKDRALLERRGFFVTVNVDGNLMLLAQPYAKVSVQ